jgi:DNA-directed RNA polymerase specialized sigma24 family protein
LQARRRRGGRTAVYGLRELLLRLEEIYEEQFEYVFKLVSLLGGPGFGAEAATEAVFGEMDRRIGQTGGAIDVRTELQRIALRVVRQVRRSTPRRRRLRDQIAGDAREVAYQILDEMPPREREALILAEFAQMGSDEMARVYRSTAPSVAARVERAKAVFARRFEKGMGRGK